MELNTGLHRIECRIGDSKPLFQHLIAGPDAWLWVDTGIADTPDRYLAGYLTEHGLRPAPRQLAVITHADVDHYGGLARHRRQHPGLIAMAHAADAPLITSHRLVMSQRYLMHTPQGLVLPAERQQQLLDRAGDESAIDVLLGGGEVIDLDTAGRWDVLHLPGHSAGHLGVWRQSTGEAIIGDAALGWGTENLARVPVQAPPYYDVAAYLQTVDRLAGLQLDVLYTSHFPVLRGHQITEFLADCRAAVEQIANAVARCHTADDPVDLADLCHRVHARLGRWPVGTELTLADAISAHLAAAETLS